MQQTYIEYIDVEFDIEFEKPFLFFTFPSIVFRSILGSQLYTIACIARKNTCKTCQFNKSCIYAIIFETIIDKNTLFLSGRDKGSHPFRIKVNSFEADKPFLHFSLTLQLYGFAIQYLPYIFYALQKAGEKGLFKQRAVYKIKQVRIKNENILKKDGSISMEFSSNCWNAVQNDNIKEMQKTIIIKSPLRFKTGGRYKKLFTAQEFLLCVYRRFVTICSLYGRYECEKSYIPSANLKIETAELEWKDYIYHSYRQKKIIKLGGLMGEFTITGAFGLYEQIFLDFAHIFGAGKNTNFGLGSIEIR